MQIFTLKIKRLYNRTCIAIHDEILKHSTINVGNHFYYFFAQNNKNGHYMMIKDI